jgi:hypothetical protein
MDNRWYPSILPGGARHRRVGPARRVAANTTAQLRHAGRWTPRLSLLSKRPVRPTTTGRCVRSGATTIILRPWGS